MPNYNESFLKNIEYLRQIFLIFFLIIYKFQQHQKQSFTAVSISLVEASRISALKYSSKQTFRANSWYLLPNSAHKMNIFLLLNILNLNYSLKNFIIIDLTGNFYKIYESAWQLFEKVLQYDFNNDRGYEYFKLYIKTYLTWHSGVSITW